MADPYRICWVCDQKPAESEDGVCPSCRLKPKQSVLLGSPAKPRPPQSEKRKPSESELEAWAKRFNRGKLFGSK